MLPWQAGGPPAARRMQPSGRARPGGQVNGSRGGEGVVEVRRAYEYTLDRVGTDIGAPAAASPAKTPSCATGHPRPAQRDMLCCLWRQGSCVLVKPGPLARRGALARRACAARPRRSAEPAPRAAERRAALGGVSGAHAPVWLCCPAGRTGGATSAALKTPVKNLRARARRRAAVAGVHRVPAGAARGHAGVSGAVRRRPGRAGGRAAHHAAQVPAAARRGGTAQPGPRLGCAPRDFCATSAVVQTLARRPTRMITSVGGEGARAASCGAAVLAMGWGPVAACTCATLRGERASARAPRPGPTRPCEPQARVPARTGRCHQGRLPYPTLYPAAWGRRRAYQRALAVPSPALEALWRAYEQFESGFAPGPARVLGRRLLDEARRRYPAARGALRERQARLAALAPGALPLPPGARRARGAGAGAAAAMARPERLCDVPGDASESSRVTSWSLLGARVGMV